MKPDLNTAILILGFILVWLSNRYELGRIETRLLAIEGDLRRFYQILGEHSEAIANTKKKLDL